VPTLRVASNITILPPVRRTSLAAEANSRRVSTATKANGCLLSRTSRPVCLLNSFAMVTFQQLIHPHPRFDNHCRLSQLFALIEYLCRSGFANDLDHCQGRRLTRSNRLGRHRHQLFHQWYLVFVIELHSCIDFPLSPFHSGGLLINDGASLTLVKSSSNASESSKDQTLNVTGRCLVSGTLTINLPADASGSGTVNALSCSHIEGKFNTITIYDSSHTRLCAEYADYNAGVLVVAYTTWPCVTAVASANSLSLSPLFALTLAIALNLVK